MSNLEECDACQNGFKTGHIKSCPEVLEWEDDGRAYKEFASHRLVFQYDGNIVLKLR